VLSESESHSQTRINILNFVCQKLAYDRSYFTKNLYFVNVVKVGESTLT